MDLEKKEYLYKFAVDTWYEKKIPERFTFETKILDLTPKEGEAIIRSYQSNNRKDVVLEEGHKRILKKLTKRVSETIKRNG